MVRREPHNKILTSEDLDIIIKSYQDGLSPHQIRIDILKGKVKTDKSIVDALKKSGFYTHRERIFYSNTKNHNYFSNINNEYKAYFLGLLQSDGWLHHKSENSKQIGLSLFEDDKYMVEFFKKELDTTNKIVKRTYGDGNIKDTYQLIVDSPILYNDLEKYYISDKFDKQFMPASLGDNLLNHYIRGLFDGDGTVCITPKTKNIHIGFLGSRQSMSQLSFYLSYKLGIYQTQPRKSDSQSNIELYTLRYAEKQDTEKIYKFLYQNANLYLTRKKVIFDEWFNN